MIKTHYHIPGVKQKPKLLYYLHPFKQIVLPPFYWILGLLYKVPGLSFYYKVVSFGIKLWFCGEVKRDVTDVMLKDPVDSVRFFEYDFMWRAVTSYKTIGRYLDISSPRLFSTIVLKEHENVKADIVNPDDRDLTTTKNILTACGLANRCTFHRKLIDELTFVEEFDTIVCISVLEHIPDDGDYHAINKIWQMLKPGGRLLVSVPCAKEAFEEYLDVNQYGLLPMNDENTYFGQRFYDSKLLQDRFFKVTGVPVSFAVYGEKTSGLYDEVREERISNPLYPVWKEPYMMGKKFRYFDSIDQLPGIGVIAMEFVKS